MKQIAFILLSGLFFLTTCGQNLSETQITPTLVVETSTPSPLPTATRTSLPTSTPTAPITPLPTIPAFTPTFDASTIVTVTPAPKAECPKENPNLTNFQFNFGLISPSYKYVDNSTIDGFMTYLNTGGRIDKILEILNQIDTNFKYQDITNDNNPDLIFVSGALFESLNILYCSDGQYVRFPSEGDDWEAIFGEHINFDIQDLNKNNIQDILSIAWEPRNMIVKIWEWNGQSFMDLTSKDTFVTGLIITNAEIIDINNDGIFEMIENGQIYYEPYPGQPLRAASNIFFWNGTTYSPISIFNTPEYRFQAIQDGDIQTLQGNYPEAIKSYKDAIESTNLDWWSKEKFTHNREAVINFATPSVLAVDPTEYPRLAAYAYYRIMLLHIVQNHETDATTTYNTLQEKFGNDPYAHPYVEMASAFWEAYRSTHKMYDGCAAAIQYAAEHPEILIPLGSDYHGAQSHTYVPADVCPFR